MIASSPLISFCLSHVQTYELFYVTDYRSICERFSLCMFTAGRHEAERSSQSQTSMIKCPHTLCCRCCEHQADWPWWLYFVCHKQSCCRLALASSPWVESKLTNKEWQPIGHSSVSHPLPGTVTSEMRRRVVAGQSSEDAKHNHAPLTATQ